MLAQQKRIKARRKKYKQTNVTKEQAVNPQKLYKNKQLLSQARKIDRKFKTKKKKT
jgi:hypothetical protein